MWCCELVRFYIAEVLREGWWIGQLLPTVKKSISPVTTVAMD